MKKFSCKPMTFFVDEDQRRMIVEKADREMVSYSAVLRQILQAAFAKQRQAEGHQ